MLIWYLSADDVLQVHFDLVEFFARDGDSIYPPGPRDENLVHSACHRPRTSLAGYDKYPSVEGKAAALLHSLVMDHPFHNGNKRTALASTVLFLDRNERRLTATDDELFDLVLGVATGRLPDQEPPSSVDVLVLQIQHWLAAHVEVAHPRPSSMKTKQFLESCKRAGARVRSSRDKRSWIVQGPGGESIRLDKVTRELGGMVVRRYVQILGLGENVTGVPIEEFQEGLNPEQRLIRRLRSVLLRLASV